MRDTGHTRKLRSALFSAAAALAAPALRADAAAAPALVAAAGAPSFAIFYGKPVPTEWLAHFDRVVLEADNADDAEIRALRDAGTVLYAYLSVGEAHASRPWHDELDSSWRLGRNAAWDSDVLDLRQHGWRALLLRRAAALRRRGFDGLFLDTLDSYRALGLDAAGNEAQARALASLVSSLAEVAGGTRLVLNRGFEVLDAIDAPVDAVAAESLFRGWDPQRRVYREVPENDRDWLLARLREVQERRGIPALAIDYAAPGERELARRTARRIAELGLVPWVASPRHDTIGVGALEVLPSSVLLVHDGAEQDALDRARRLLGPPLAWLGYRIEPADLRQGLPARALSGIHAGIITWFADDDAPDNGSYRRWLTARIDEGLRIAVFGRIGFDADAAFLARLGLERLPEAIEKPLRVRRRDALATGDSEVQPRARALSPLGASSGALAVHLSLEDARGQEAVAAATGPWGGVVLDPYAVDVGFHGRERWTIDPFEFLERALDLPRRPVPDATTENGRRILVCMVDGEGAAIRAAMPGTPFAIEVILEKILQVYRLPTAVSVLEAEIGSSGLYPESAPRLERAARDIFRLPHVETAAGGAGARPADSEPAAGVAPRRRLEAIVIRYPFASGAGPATLTAIERAYDEALRQEPLPVFASEHAERVRDAGCGSAARRLDGAWSLLSCGRIRTVRLPRELGWPDLKRSSEVAWLRDVPQGRYLGFVPARRAVLHLQDAPPAEPHLVQTNARLLAFRRHGKSLHVRFAAHAPIEVAVGGEGEVCRLRWQGGEIEGRRGSGEWTFTIPATESGDAVIDVE